MNHGDRERLKREGWAQLADLTLPAAARAAALLKVITAHWHRATEGVEHRHTPPLATYAAHWLAANGDNVKEKEIVAILRRDFPPPARCNLEPGKTTWRYEQEWPDGYPGPSTRIKRRFA